MTTSLIENDKETWQNIPGYEEYQISNFGKIKNKNNKILKGWIQNTGYLTIGFKEKKFSVHRLVAQAFIPNPNNLPIVNHKDGNKLNNNANNLEWCTYKHNLNEAIKLGLIHIKYASKDNKIRAKKISQYDLQNKYIRTFLGSVEAEKELKKLGVKVNARNIRKVCEHKQKTAGGYIWRYTIEVENEVRKSGNKKR